VAVDTPYTVVTRETTCWIQLCRTMASPTAPTVAIVANVVGVGARTRYPYRPGPSACIEYTVGSAGNPGSWRMRHIA
jgi:hypothetical protein